MDPTKVARPDLSAKLERLRKGLVSDTISLGGRRFPSLKYSQINYGLKSGRLGAYDPLRRRSKLFRSAVSRFAPPYYFWHKEFINNMKLKRLVKAEKPKPSVDDQTSELVSCVWCQQSIIRTDYEFHRTKRCKRRHEFLTNGYYRCSSCDKAFLDEEKARSHVLLHFPVSQTEVGKDGVSQKSQKKVSIICRDQAKRKKWL